MIQTAINLLFLITGAIALASLAQSLRDYLKGQ
jgi:hypothetical protein